MSEQVAVGAIVVMVVASFLAHVWRPLRERNSRPDLRLSFDLAIGHRVASQTA